MIYLDNAATSFPKPAVIYDALKTSVCNCCGNPSRGGHLPSRKSAKLLYDARESIAKLFGSDKAENVVFTHNATEALNTAIKGLVSEGDHILISDIEHNSVRRVAYALKDRNVSYSIYSTWGTPQKVIDGIEQLITPDTTLLVACHRSNICSRTLPLEQIGRYCKKKSLKFVVDASQTAGGMSINIKNISADVICAPGHKGLFGIMGSGFMLFSDSTDPSSVKTLCEGGSGVNSVNDMMPDLFPERLEAGTVPLPAISTLGAGAEYVWQVGADVIGEKENKLMRRAKEMFANTKGIKVYDLNENEGAVLLFNIEGLNSEDSAYLLDKKGVYVRAGLHCAPLAHRSIIGSLDGAVRASFGFFNTLQDVEMFYKSTRELIGRI